MMPFLFYLCAAAQPQTGGPLRDRPFSVVSLYAEETRTGRYACAEVVRYRPACQMCEPATKYLSDLVTRAFSYEDFDCLPFECVGDCIDVAARPLAWNDRLAPEPFAELFEAYLYGDDREDPAASEMVRILDPAIPAQAVDTVRRRFTPMIGGDFTV
jgi:hypothetical protein